MTDIDIVIDIDTKQNWFDISVNNCIYWLEINFNKFYQ